MASFLFLSVASGLGAQDSAEVSAGAPSRRLSLTVGGGAIYGGPAAASMDQLRRLGFDQTSPGGCGLFFCWGAQSHPNFLPGGRTSVTVRYELSERWAVSAGRGAGSAGSTTGYRDGATLYSDWTTRAFWGAWHLKLDPRLSLGWGLAVHRFASSSASDRGSVTRFGVTGESSLRLPARSRFFVDLTVRGHWVPGTIEVTLDAVEIWGPTRQVTLPTRPSHATLELGVGVRL